MMNGRAVVIGGERLDVRPFVDAWIAADDARVVIVGTRPVVDALKQVSGDVVRATIDRTVLRAADWPVVVGTDLWARVAVVSSEVAEVVSGLITVEPGLRVVAVDQPPQQQE